MNKRKRLSHEQREQLLQFMLGHEDLARNRVGGPDAARKKEALLTEMAELLNAMGSGATKTPKLWLKCWQDWRSDVKAKALSIKKYSAQTGGGPAPPPLTKLEETLLQFFGVEMVQGLDVPDPLELETDGHPNPQPIPSQFCILEEAIEMSPLEAPLPEEKTERQAAEVKKPKKDPLQDSLNRQAAAIESLAAGIQNMTVALQEIAAAIRDQPKIIVSEQKD